MAGRHPIMKPDEKLGMTGRILIGLLILVAVTIGIFLLSIIFKGIGGFAGEVFMHIRHLFRDATHAFRTPRGFGAFIELILIVVVISWAIKRIMNYIGRK